MDAVLRPRATENSFGPNKQIRMKNRRGNLVSNNVSKNIDTYAGLLNHPPPSRAMSFSYSHSLSASAVFNQHHAQVQQPPLLPLPHPHVSRDMSLILTPKKSKATKISGTQSMLIVASDNRWGPDPENLPKHLPVVLTPKAVPGMGSVFNLSPPPSSLPLPKFSLRAKLACNAEAVGGSGVDDGATNNLRRLLRLR